MCVCVLLPVGIHRKKKIMISAAAATEPTVTMAPLSQGDDDDAHSVTDTVKAVSVRNASKSYGVGKRRSSVLSSLDMSVQKGTM